MAESIRVVKTDIRAVKTDIISVQHTPKTKSHTKKTHTGASAELASAPMITDSLGTTTEYIPPPAPITTPAPDPNALGTLAFVGFGFSGFTALGCCVLVIWGAGRYVRLVKKMKKMARVAVEEAERMKEEEERERAREEEQKLRDLEDLREQEVSVL